MKESISASFLFDNWAPSLVLHTDHFVHLFCEAFFFSPLLFISLFLVSKGPPSAPQNLIFNINQTTVSLEWSPPADNGGRNDVTYRILCKRCSWEQGECVPCGSNIGYMPQQSGLEDNYVTVMDLLAHANYTFEVEAVNGVSDLSRSQRLFAAVSITTGQAGMFCVCLRWMNDVTVYGKSCLDSLNI